MPNLNNQVSGSAIAFIDTQVENYQSLIAGVKPGTEVVVLDANRDAIDQITQILRDRTNIDSIHIVSHGAPGSLQLGDVRLSLDDIECDRDSLQQWFSQRTDSTRKNRPNILLYGCCVAAGETGKAFVKRLSELTGARVAASQNLTGSVAKGGDWELEVSTGKIETPLVFEAEVLAGYEYVLATFGPATNFPITYSLRKVATADFNKDGNLDLAFATTGPNRNVSITLGNGTGQFGAATNLNTSPPSDLSTWSVAVGDFNKDGNSDLVTANNATNNVSLLLGNGNGTFGAATYFGVGSSPYTVAVADFNGDGNSDLATANQTSNNVSILRGNGNGTFGAATNLSVGSTPYFVVVGDFNKDGKSDLATANFGSSSVSILLQNANGTFAPATNFTVGNNPNYIALGDFNGDNNLDLATSNQNSNNVSILLGNGTGSFTTATNFSVGTQPLAIASGDFNGDGKVDLATANNSSGNVSVLFGSGNGSFGTATNFVVGASPQGIVVGDFNKDGLSDLATANFNSQNTSILLNTSPAVNFGAATYSATEGTADTVVNIPVTLSRTPDAAVTVPIVIDPSSTATPNSDYTISPTSITFPAGATGTALTKNVAVTIKPDNLAENAETAILNLGTITGGVAGTTKKTTLTIAANSLPSSLSPYQINLKTGTITGGPNQFISLVNTPTDSNADSWLEAVAKINLAGNIKKAKFIVEYDKIPSGWTVNIGDSVSNNGYGGDGSNQSRDAEMQIVNSNMSVNGNDYNTPPGGFLTQGSVTNLVSNGSRVELEVSNEKLAWDNKSGLKNSLTSPYLYALNGQPDATGPVNSEIYAGFNRVISGPFDRIGSGASKATILLNPIDYAISAGTATVTEGNSGNTAIAFTVTRTGSTELTSSVNYTIAGTASNVSDYNNIGGTSGANSASGPINFAAGETSKTITLNVLGDLTIEPSETINVTLSNPSGLNSTPTITTATATTTITNDDQGALTVNPISGLTTTNVAEGTVSANSLTFTPANSNSLQQVTSNPKGSDPLLGSSSDDALLGSSGADILNGGDGNDILYGGKGDDLLNGGLGMDTLTGGMGADKFLLSTNSGTDTITDFEVGQDLLVLGNGLTLPQLTIAQDSGATLIRFAETGEIIASLTGVSANSISAENFGLI
jgi:Ca2+-binding RTX toxin-like protein